MQVGRGRGKPWVGQWDPNLPSRFFTKRSSEETGSLATTLEASPERLPPDTSDQTDHQHTGQFQLQVLQRVWMFPQAVDAVSEALMSKVFDSTGWDSHDHRLRYPPCLVFPISNLNAAWSLTPGSKMYLEKDLHLGDRGFFGEKKTH